MIDRQRMENIDCFNMARINLLEEARRRRADRRRQIQAKAMDVANRHPLNRCAREMLAAAGEPVGRGELYVMQLMSWRLYAVECLESELAGVFEQLKAIEKLEYRVERLIEIERNPYEAMQRFDVEGIRSNGFAAIECLLTDEWYQLETNKRLEATNWRANRPDWLGWKYQAELMMVALMDCTPLTILRYLLSLEVWDGCWKRENYGGIEEWTPEKLADTILWALGYSYDDFYDDKWDKWTTAEGFMPE